MGIALLTTTRLFAPLHGLIGWLTPSTPQPARPCRTLGRKQEPTAIKSIAPGDQPARATNRKQSHAAPNRPLKVVRVLDGQHAPACAGRMVISGRMADVCAELDRLVACEAARR
ncbi:MAG: hypothetical protein ACRECD_13340 [Burkholderiaceae bacterium]